jgi:hypothetical protein
LAALLGFDTGGCGASFGVGGMSDDAGDPLQLTAAVDA